MAIQPDNAPDELIARLFGDELKPLEAMSKAIDRVNELMKPSAAETFFSTNKRRHMVYDRVPVGHGTGYRCYDGTKHDSESAFDSGEYGDGMSEDEAYFAWLRDVDADPTPAPRLRLVDGGGGVQPPEYAEDRRDDPDEPQ